ncbi:septal ring lytic transglycosylase RlpA family protein [Kaistia nematophila]|uniref:septal ring lytic transglycosylase RlpA family protein n=1 Tax=Kaistia nematophila TaxID=2994654 RepID=UPI003B97A26B
MGISKKYILGLLGPDAPQGRVMLKAATAVAAAALLASCATAPSKPTKRSKEYFSEKEYGVKASPRVVEYGQPVPQGGGRYMVGKAYTVKGRVYKPFENKRYTAVGYASWYGSAFHGRYTANGEVYDMDGFSAAHPTMPLPSYARVTNLRNGRSITVRVNDRGPYASDRVMDLSSRTAEVLDMKHHGTAKVKVEYIGPARMEGHDQAMLLASYRGPGSSVSGDTMLAMAPKPALRAPSADPTIVMAALAPVPRTRPDYYGGTAFDPAVAYYEAQPAPRVVADAAPAPVPAGSNYGERSLGTYTVSSPVGYSDAEPVPASWSSDDYAPPVPRSARSSYAADATVSPAQLAAAEMASGARSQDKLQAALDAAVQRAAADRGADAPVIQLGVFSNTSNAEALAGRFADLGRVTAASISVGGKTMQSVRLVVADRTLNGEEAVRSVRSAGLPGAYLVTR